MSTDVVVDCTHPRANHQHGTYLAYRVDRCRCDPCKAAQRRHAKQQAYATLTQTHSYVDAAPARKHVERLLAAGLTRGQIEARSGVNRTSIKVLLGVMPGYPRSKRIARTTAAALLAVKPVALADEQHGLVDSTGTLRRLRALVAVGWPMRYLVVDRLGMSVRDSYIFATIGRPYVYATTARKVRALYDELWDQRWPRRRNESTRARNIAQARGWAPPAAWDDDTIDLPDATPNLGTVAPVAGGVTADDRLDDWLHLVKSGEDLERAARRVGWTAKKPLDAVRVAARRLGRDDAITVLDQAAATAHAERVHVIPTETPTQRARRRTTARSTAAA